LELKEPEAVWDLVFDVNGFEIGGAILPHAPVLQQRGRADYWSLSLAPSEREKTLISPRLSAFAGATSDFSRRDAATQK
jgi:hypothetical protein